MDPLALTAWWMIPGNSNRLVKNIPDELQRQTATPMHCVQVLGHHMSKRTAALYSSAQSVAQWDVKVLPCIDDGLEMQQGNAKSKLEQNVEQYLSR